jgi:hypothetical protein
MALQTHINDIMMKRYSKAQAAVADGAAPPAAGGAGGDANFGPKYQAHVAELQRQLDEAVEAVEAKDRQIAELTEARAELADELGAIKGGAGGGAGGAGVDLSSLSLGAGGDAAMVAAVEARIRGAEGERAALQQKVARMEEAHRAELAAAAAALEAATGGGAAREAAKAKEAKINELMEELGSKELLLSEAQAAVAASAGAAKELEELREMKEDVERKEKAQAELISGQAKRLEELEKLYRDEALSRKKIHNAMEDMKGKIRVYCRVRPLLGFERERGQAMAVDIPDELTIALKWQDNKKREFSFDAVFPGDTTQDRVFADCRHLMQSAVDGYNVCIFAYGQTGSGKTFTIYGSEELPGLTPRGITELFDILERDAGKISGRVEVHMLELYIDDLQDLLAGGPRGEKSVGLGWGGGGKAGRWAGLPDGCVAGRGAWRRRRGGGGAACMGAPGQRACRRVAPVASLWSLRPLPSFSPALLLTCPPLPRRAQHKSSKLEIKKDPKGVVTVPGATVVEVSSARELLATIEEGQKRRHVSSTQMNRESSRSHLIITVCVETTNLQTQNVARGKLSFVDLAGSERVKKSGSVGEQLKEAHAINKSLSALGNVISALATEQGHIPYRDHKLTMLMSDSIGGTAKTLMFVNVSPVDGNLDETNNSLQYATRVSTIKNNVKQDDSSREVVALKRKIDYWKEQAGLPEGRRDYVDLVEIEDAQQNGE